MINPKAQKRMVAIISILAALMVALGLMLYALKQNINLFYTPSELMGVKLPDTTLIRVGGMVKTGSVQYLQSDSQVVNVQFVIDDTQTEMRVTYHGVLPDLFKEGQGVVVQGYWRKPEFQAIQVLAKHDENYMPPELNQRLKVKHVT